MPARTTGRVAAVLTLVAVALLGSAYGLGRSLVPDPPRRDSGVATSVDGAHYADQPPEPSADDRWGRTSESPGLPQASQDEAPTAEPPAADGDGPFGSRISTGSPQVALTFDDGPDPQWTPQVLELLRAYHVRATFCLVGQNAQDHPDLVQQIVADGHTLCNHSWSHDLLLGKRSPDQIRADLSRTSEAIRAAVPDARIAYFRQPGGNWTYPLVSVCQELGLTPLHWSVDPSDWQAPGSTKIINSVLTATGPGSVVLMHDAGGDRRGTVEALYTLLPELQNRYGLEPLPTGTT
ncbi:polysaccharide deacetylase family protein [Micromonospora mirobrigensis]|uniref:Peptidoglycan/xylan/chitin deacetylase, PgdA/CDA1 family n=1 Tax=Micromonospora mirobrigensis TaxID=262898 RepID=A0A1C4ZTJ8_9ACTN|nr:polysaccharide deacetylase family protein [Micromonospora mirobrigensis]SCF36290.1 Peptidoglycan/xylan/chitin deacetylase, PgdA/CDA1 family [Micromonospora mirobrigensis]